MAIKKTASVYMITVGVMIISLWVMLISTGSVTEFTEEPLDISFHIAAEFLTAVLLLSSGIGLIKKNKWSMQLSYISLGALLYTIINSSGYYAQRSEPVFLIMFGVLFIFTSTILVLLAKNLSD